VDSAARAAARNIRKNNRLCELVIKDGFYNEFGAIVPFGTKWSIKTGRNTKAGA
jgi:hypothetical protein